MLLYALSPPLLATPPRPTSQATLEGHGRVDVPIRGLNCDGGIEIDSKARHVW